MSYASNLAPIAASATGLDFAHLAEQYGHIPVREITSSTSGIALAQLVAARAGLQLLTLIDARNICRVEPVPPGGGKTYHFQKVVAVAPSGNLTEGSDLVAQDQTLGDQQATLVVFAIRTDVSDLAQRQAAINFAETIGIAHGNGMNRQVNNDIYTALLTSTTNNINLGTFGDATVATPSWANIFSLRQLIEAQRGMPNFWVSGTKTFYGFIINNITAVQFTAALADYLRSDSGAKPNFIGLRPYVDTVYGEGTGVNGEFYAHVGVSNEAVGFAQAEDIVSEIQRWAPQVGFRIVTHLTGKTALVLEPFLASVKHA